MPQAAACCRQALLHVLDPLAAHLFIAMERFTISLDDQLAKAFDEHIAMRGYSNRSEAVRDILHVHLAGAREDRDADGPCIACLSYVYNHHERELSERLARIQHADHALTISTTHAHLDHDNCLETVLLRGPMRAVRRFAERIIAERGVHHGSVNVVAVEPHAHHHRHSHAPSSM